jgi:hypothetical protein
MVTVIRSLILSPVAWTFLCGDFAPVCTLCGVPLTGLLSVVCYVRFVVKNALSFFLVRCATCLELIAALLTEIILCRFKVRIVFVSFDAF